jgi:RNA polymerase sigma factor for flagellar operon FliA
MVSPNKDVDAGVIGLENHAAIERVIDSIARRNSLYGDVAGDFRSWAWSRLLDNDYAIIKKFQGRSRFTTYLTAVVANLFRDFRIQHLGRWRASIAAKRMGDLAVRLEALLYRDGYSLNQAQEVLRSSGLGHVTSRELSAIAARLPKRVVKAPRTTDEIDGVAGEIHADDELWQSERSGDWATIQTALARALESLPAEDRLIIRLRFWEGWTIADVARALDLEQKPLYRRIQRGLDQLRKQLERDGVNQFAIAEFFAEEISV